MAESRIPIGQVLILRHDFERIKGSRHATPHLVRLLDVAIALIDELIERREKEFEPCRSVKVNRS
jgi:hypothetical protein